MLPFKVSQIFFVFFKTYGQVGNLKYKAEVFVLSKYRYSSVPGFS